MVGGALQRPGYRGLDLAAAMTKRRFVLTAVLGACLALGGCSSFAGAVSDAWPTWAGGMPKDVPPRPGAPGYEEFIAHQQRQDAAANAAAPGAAVPAAAPGTVVTSAPAGAPATPAAVPPPVAQRPVVVPPAGSANTQPLPPAYARPDDRSTTQGGLY